MQALLVADLQDVEFSMAVGATRLAQEVNKLAIRDGLSGGDVMTAHWREDDVVV